MNDEALPAVEIVDLPTPPGAFQREVLAGLRRPRKTLPCKYFYDESGSALFERICQLDEYYPTRTELGILASSGKEMAEALGPRCLVVEYGSGSGTKTRLLLDRLEEPAAYVPVDISREPLQRFAAELALRYPDLPIQPVCADFNVTRTVPLPDVPAARRVVYFPGSTIGNFERAEAEAFLRDAARLCGPGGGLLVGADLRKDPARLVAAYDDAEGVTAAFNRNLLRRVNRELDADFEPERFAHRALWVDPPGRIEMHLVSTRRQSVAVAGERFEFTRGETIHTESSHKYGLAEFAAIGARAGLSVERIWTDPEALFSVQYLAAP